MKEKIKDIVTDKSSINIATDNSSIQALLDKYLAGDTSNEEEEMLRNYFEEHGDDIPEEWKSFRALFSFVGFERLNFLDSEEDISEEDISEEVKHRSLRRYMAISAAAAIAIILMITGIYTFSSQQWAQPQTECYAVIDGKVYTNPEKVHDEALNALQGLDTEEQDDAFEALDMMQ